MGALTLVGKTVMSLAVKSLLNVLLSMLTQKMFEEIWRDIVRWGLKKVAGKNKTTLRFDVAETAIEAMDSNMDPATARKVKDLIKGIGN